LEGDISEGPLVSDLSIRAEEYEAMEKQRREFRTEKKSTTGSGL